MKKNEILEELKKLTEGGGFTMRNYKLITYRTGYQVATRGRKTRDIMKALQYVLDFKGNCGLWLENGVYYVDCSIRIANKQDALEIGRACNQISILNWNDMSLIYC